MPLTVPSTSIKEVMLFLKCTEYGDSCTPMLDFCISQPPLPCCSDLLLVELILKQRYVMNSGSTFCIVALLISDTDSVGSSLPSQGGLVNWIT